MVELRRTVLDQRGLSEVAGLLAPIFTALRGLDDRYLAWWYRDNPRGQAIAFTAFDRDVPVAHAGTSIIRGVFEGSEESGIRMQDTATLDRYRGQGLFSRLVQAILEEASRAGHTFAIGAANAASCPIYTRDLGFQLVCPLDVHVGPGLPARRGSELESAFSLAWTPAALAWRLHPPHKHYRTRQRHGRTYVLGSSGVPRVPVVLSSFDQPPEGLDPSGPVPTSVWVGLDPGRRWPIHWPAVPVRVRPAPLHLVFRDLRSDRKLDPARVRIDAIDIDQF